MSDAAVAELAKVGSTRCLAQALKRAIQQRIENPLSKLLLEGRFRAQGHHPRGRGPHPRAGEFQFQRLRPLYNLPSTVAIAQLVESRIVIPVVVGSSPISHPR